MQWLSVNKKCTLSVCFHRVDHLYTFFVQWSPEIYTKGNKKHRFLIREKIQKRYVVVEKNKVAVINKLLTNPASHTAKNWEVSFALTRMWYKWNFSCRLTWGQD